MWDSLSYFTKTSRIILDTGQQYRLLNNFENFIPNIASDVDILREITLEKSADFL